MSQAVTKHELLQRLHAHHRQLRQLIAPLTSNQLEAKGVIGSWSIKDTIAHFIAHEQFALRELAAAQRGEVYQNPYTDTDLMNAHAVADCAELSIQQVMRAWEKSFQQVIQAVESLQDGDFAEDSSVMRWLNDTIDGALANNTYDHYVEHTPAIEAWIQQH